MTKTTTPAETNEPMALRDLADSLNGWEELAVAKKFGASIEELKGTMAARALVFVEFRREGSNDVDAHKRAMSMALGDLKSRYPDLDDNDGVPDPMATLEDEGKA